MIVVGIALAGVDGPSEVRVGETVVLAADHQVTWWKRDVVPDDYDNAAYCGPPTPGCAQPLQVRWTQLGTGKRLELELDVGAHHFAITDGLDSPRRDLPDHTVAVRLDDSYVGVLHELIDTPFVFAPAWLDEGHQTDGRLATDCVALVIYGQRRLGRKVPYVSPWKLYDWLEPVQDELREGDVLHWGWQTAVVAEDRAPVGVLNADDELILAWKGRAERRPLGSLPFAGTPVAQLRWPDPRKEERAPERKRKSQ